MLHQDLALDRGCVLRDDISPSMQQKQMSFFAFDLEQMTRVLNIVADGWARASNFHPHSTRYTKISHFSTFWLNRHGPMDPHTNRWTDKASYTCPQLKIYHVHKLFYNWALGRGGGANTGVNLNAQKAHDLGLATTNFDLATTNFERTDRRLSASLWISNQTATALA